ncbi:ribosome rescue GTPase HflX [Allohahella marinimesophila]|uniref:GTPase HflX n=1 Tax=Allohahella marinimesophila TaxID=1054972 RepID=A0ABP7NIT5_9GAMM
MFDRPDTGERALLVHLELDKENDCEDPQEFVDLALSAGVEVLEVVSVNRHHATPKFFVGSGKVEELSAIVRLHKADVVLFNHALSPSQERNLEKAMEVRVLDRVGLILDIFAQRARTHEGKLQVELAQLEYMSTRLIRGWTHLERQKGGIGLRGPGETQLETDRRLLRARIKSIHKRLEKVRRQREQGRRARLRNEVPVVALVGYTNAGKSTLFNRLTSSDVFAANQLFATLDPTLRRIELDGFGPIIFADTVGFIRHLPHKLVDAFRATLEETRDADLLLHLVDASDPRRDDNQKQVAEVLKEIGADTVPAVKVMNKIDALDQAQWPLDSTGGRVDRDAEGLPERVWVSAANGQGIDTLLDTIAELLGTDVRLLTIRCDMQMHSRLRSRFFERNVVENEAVDEEGRPLLTVRIEQHILDQLLSHADVKLSEILVEDHAPHRVSHKDDEFEVNDNDDTLPA